MTSEMLPIEELEDGPDMLPIDQVEDAPPQESPRKAPSGGFNLVNLIASRMAPSAQQELPGAPATSKPSTFQAPRPTRADLADEQAAIAEQDKAVTPESAKAVNRFFDPLYNVGQRGAGSALMKLDQLASAATGFDRLSMTPGQRWKHDRQRKLSVLGQGLIESADETHPVIDPNSLASKMGSAVGGFFPGIAGGPLAPVIFGLQSAGAEGERIYAEEIAKGKSEDEAATIATRKSNLIGVFQGLLLKFFPKQAKKIGDKALDKVVGTAFKETLAQQAKRLPVSQAINSAEGAAFGAVSQAGNNLIEGRPVTEHMGESVSGMALIMGATPKGMTGGQQARSQAHYKARAAEQQRIAVQSARQKVREDIVREEGEVTKDELDELSDLQEFNKKSPEKVAANPAMARRLQHLELKTEKDQVLADGHVKELETELAGENRQFEYGELGEGVASINKQGKVIIDKTNMARALADLETPAQRSALIKSVVNEEAIHGVVPNEVARDFYNAASQVERDLAHNRYHGLSKRATGDEFVKWDEGRSQEYEVLMGQEMMRARLQEMEGKSPTETAYHFGQDADKYRMLLSLERGVFGLRKMWNSIKNVQGGEPSHQQKMLDSSLEKLQKARKIIEIDKPEMAAEAAKPESAGEAQPFSKKPGEGVDGKLTHVDGMRYGKDLTEADVPRLEAQYKAAQDAMRKAFESGKEEFNDAEFAAAFGLSNFYGGALQGATKGKHTAASGNWDAFVKDGGLEKMAAPQARQPGEKKDDFLRRQREEIRMLKLQAQGVEVPKEQLEAAKLKAGPTGEAAPVAQAERVSTNFPRLTAKTIEDAATAEINRDVTAKGQSFLKKDKDSPGETVSGVRVQADRPSFERFAKSMRDVTVDVKNEQLQEVWADKVWSGLLNASGERLGQLRKALGLEGRYGSRAMGEDPLGRRDIASGEAAPEVTGEQAIRQRAILEKRLGKLEAEAETKLKEADEYDRNVTEADKEKRADELFGPSDKGQALRRQAYELRYQAAVMRRSLDAAADTSRTLRRKADVRDMTQRGLEGILPDKGKASSPLRPAERAGSMAMSQQAYRQKVIKAIAQQLIGEAYKHENRRANMERESVTLDDLDFAGKKSKTGEANLGAYTEITPGDLEFRQSDQTIPFTLKKILRNKARARNTDPESATRRVLVVVGPENKVHLLSTYNNAGEQMVTDPSVRLADRPYRPITMEWMNKYHPIASLLLKDPVKGLRQEFDSVSHFRDEIGKEAEERSQVGDDLLELSHPEQAQFEAEGTRGLEGETGSFMGPERGLVDPGNRNPALQSGRPLGRNEAVAVAKYQTAESVRRAVDKLIRMVADKKKPTAAQMVELSAFRKISNQIEAGRKQDPELTSNPDLADAQVRDRLAEQIVRAHDLGTPVGSLLRAFGEQALPGNPGRTSGTPKDLTKRGDIKPPTRQDVFAGPFQRKAAPPADLGAIKPSAYIPEGVARKQPAEEAATRLNKARDITLRTFRKYGKILNLKEAGKLAGMEPEAVQTAIDIGFRKTRGPMSKSPGPKEGKEEFLKKNTKLIGDLETKHDLALDAVSQKEIDDLVLPTLEGVQNLIRGKHFKELERVGVFFENDQPKFRNVKEEDREYAYRLTDQLNKIVELLGEMAFIHRDFKDTSDQQSFPMSKNPMSRAEFKEAKDRFVKWAKGPTLVKPEALMMDYDRPLARFSSNIDSQLTQAFGFELVPILGELMGPRAQVRDPVDRANLGYSAKRTIGNSISALHGARLRALSERLGQPFKVAEDGKIENVKVLEANQSTHPSDLFEDWQRQVIIPEKMRAVESIGPQGQSDRIYSDSEIGEYTKRNRKTFELTPNQEKMFREFYDILEDGHAYLNEKKTEVEADKSDVADQMMMEGIPKGLEVYSFPRPARHRRGFKEIKDETLRRIGGKYEIDQERLYPRESEGAEHVVYEPDMIKRMVTFSARVYKAVADADLRNNPVFQGENMGPERMRTLSMEYEKDLRSGKKSQEDMAQMAYNPRLSTEGVVPGHPAFQDKIYPAEIAKKLNRAFGPQPHHTVDLLAELSTASKALTLTGDIAQFMTQGSVVMARNPKAWGRAVSASMKSIAKENVTGRFLEDPANWRAAQELAQHGVSIGHLQDFMSGSKPGELATTIPGVRQLVERSGRGFGTFFDIAKVELWKSLRDVTPKEQWAEQMEMIENMTLSGKMEAAGLSGPRSIVERLIFMAPSYYRAGLQLVAGLAAKGATGNETRKALGSFAGAQVMTMVGAYLAMGMDWDEILERLTPGQRNQKFLSFPIKVGNTEQEIGLGNIVNDLASLGADMGRAARNNVMGVKNKETLNPLSKDNPLTQFILKKLGPVPGLAMKWATGKDAIGRPANLGTAITGATLPIGIQSPINRLTGIAPPSKADLPAEMVKSVAGAVGLRARTTSVLNDVSQKARDFMEENKYKKETGWEMTQVDGPSYSSLRAAAMSGSQREFNKAYDGLLETHTEKEIEKAMEEWSKRGFTGNKKYEKLFMESLSNHDLDQYVKAIEEKQKILEAFVLMWAEH